jgi:hypothetical protein
MRMSGFNLPSAWLPIAMSLTALAIVLTHIALFGTAREPDEGAAAHLFQLLIAGQIPFMAFFAIKWLPRDSRRFLPVIAVQLAAIVAAFAPVYYFHL